MISELKKSAKDLVVRAFRYLIPVVDRTVLVRLLKLWVGRREIVGRPVVVLADYGNFTMLLESPELDGESVVLIATKRYPFHLKLSTAYRNVVRIENTPDFAHARRDELLNLVRGYDPKAVLIQNGEFLVPMANYLNRSLGLKGNSEYASQVSLEKDMMRQCLADSGIATVRFVRINHPADLKKVDFFPCVLKPTVSTGAAGVRLVTDASELKAMLSQASGSATKTEFDQSFVAEEYVVGRQFDVEGLVYDGVPQILGLVEEFYEDSFPRFEHSWFLFNPNIGHEAEQKIAEVVGAALKAAEIVHGAFHCELRITDEGRIKIIEFSNRMGGGFEGYLEQATGNSFVDLYVAYMLDRRRDLAPNQRRHMLQRYSLTEAEIDRWVEFAVSNGMDWWAVRRFYREFAGWVFICTYDWTLMKKARTELLDLPPDQRLPSLIS